MSTTTSLDRIGVGIDTARYGHRVSFLRPDRQPAAKPLTVMENRAGYQALQERLKQLQEQHPQAHFHVRIDAAGQYAVNLEQFLRGLDLPMTLSIGEPKRNKDYQKAHFPKRTTDDTESQAMARFAVVEQPDATLSPSAPMVLLREVAGRLQAQVKQTTQAINRLHNLLARVFPELATLTDDVSAGWVLRLLDKYPTAERIAQAHRATLEKIPHLSGEQAEALHQAAQQSVATLRGDVAEALVRDLVTQVRHCQKAEKDLRQLLTAAFADLPSSGHRPGHHHPRHRRGHGRRPGRQDRGHRPLRDARAPRRLFRHFSRGKQLRRRQAWQALAPGHPAHVAAKAMIWCVLTSGTPLGPPSATTPPSAPSIAASRPKANAATSRSVTACASCSTWSSPSGKPIAPSTRTHFPWENPGATPLSTTTPGDPGAGATPAGNDKAVGHKRDLPAKEVVTTATSTVEPAASPVKPATPPHHSHAAQGGLRILASTGDHGTGA